MRSFIQRGWPDEARYVSQSPGLKRLTRHFRLTGRCLNAGCGEGLYVPFIDSFSEVTEVVNVDLQETSQRLRHLKPPRYQSVDASLTQLPFPDSWFDSCVCTEVIEHIPDDDTAVKELARCLRPNGRLLLSVPHKPAPYDPAHVREGYTLDELTELLRRNGLVIQESTKCFSNWMDWLLRIWRWQFAVIGRGQRNLMPRFAVRAFGYADLLIPFGRRWDLIVMAVRK